nr:MAG TPA: hypothetical protein [Caudoviricetes sp.]
MNFYTFNLLKFRMFYPHCFCTILHFLYFLRKNAQKYQRTQFCTYFVRK